ncbi:hypothetical protein ACFP7A_09270 [Sporolactobacillus kofuensis]|uniref:Glycosyl hydrolase n=1 Tax=Sporolactobacillus kofuensis TaxID=269672 RepID=A0ABW1WHU2_9BACL|nr:hypothetical protein [Sporolactobacillus kofuensis]MCO7176086.1 hypothetical protein [Sporolactobacillus kofuensis]
MSETKDQNHEESANGKSSVKWVFWLLLAKIVFILLLAGAAIWIIYTVHEENSNNKVGVHFDHVLGSGYSSDGKIFWMGNRSKLFIYHDQTWRSEPLKGSHEVVNLIPVQQGFIRVDKEGLEWRTLQQKHLRNQSLSDSNGFWGASYSNQRVYHLQQSGSKWTLKYSDDGKRWINQPIRNVRGKVQMIAAAPKDKNQLAIGTSEGLFVSDDHGLHFHHFLKGHSITALAYGYSTQPSLLAGSAGDETSLFQVLPNQKKTINLDMGTVESDRLTQIVQNPVKPEEAVVLTLHGDLYLTENAGQNWTILAKKGHALNGK